MGIRTLVLDFDGTCTDVEREAQGFVRGYQADLARLLGVSDVEALWRAKEREVLADPARHGMRIAGRIVAPPVDLFLMATAIGLLAAPHLDDEVVERLFKENYRFTSTVFRPETRGVFEALAEADAHVFVVTNSDPATVAAKLDALAPPRRERIRLHGDARKFLVTEPLLHAGSPRFARVPETLAVEGWPRPVYARRGHYFDALETIWRETGTRPDETLVVGDVFELDLALPAALGCRTHLVASPRTLPYERRAVQASGGRVDDDLGAVLAHLVS